MRTTPWSTCAQSWYPVALFVPMCSACSLLAPESEHFIGGRDASPTQTQGDVGHDTFAPPDIVEEEWSFDVSRPRPDTARAEEAEVAPADTSFEEAAVDAIAAVDGAVDGADVEDTSADAKLGRELLENPSFERGWDALGWQLDPSTALSTIADGSTFPIARVEESTGIPVVEGTRKFTSWNDQVGFTIRVYQVLAGLGDGRYVLSAHFSSAESLGSAYLYAKNCGGPDRQLPIPPSPDEYVPLIIDDIQVSGGSCEVGYMAVQDAGTWLSVDLFGFRQKL